MLEVKLCHKELDAEDSDMT